MGGHVAVSARPRASAPVELAPRRQIVHEGGRKPIGSKAIRNDVSAAHRARGFRGGGVAKAGPAEYMPAKRRMVRFGFKECARLGAPGTCARGAGAIGEVNERDADARTRMASDAGPRRQTSRLNRSGCRRPAGRRDRPAGMDWPWAARSQSAALILRACFVRDKSSQVDQA